jgi:hypothetical protein
MPFRFAPKYAFPGRWRRFLSCLDFVGASDAEVALHRAGVDKLTLLKSFEEVAEVTVSRVGGDELKRHAPGDGAVDQFQGNLDL